MAGDAPSTKQIAVTAIDDKSVEQTVETFSGQAAGLTTTAIAGAGATGTVAVTDNDSLKVDLGSAAVTEGGLSANLSATLVLVTSGTVGSPQLDRSEERCVGEEGRSRWAPYH